MRIPVICPYVRKLHLPQSLLPIGLLFVRIFVVCTLVSVVYLTFLFFVAAFGYTVGLGRSLDTVSEGSCFQMKLELATTYIVCPRLFLGCGYLYSDYVSPFAREAARTQNHLFCFFLALSK